MDLTEEEKHILENLSKISKVGRARAEKIIASGFSRVKDLEKAGVEELTSIKGIGSNIAENIFDFLEEVKDENGELRVCDECGSLVGSSAEKCPECDHTLQEEVKGEESDDEEEKKKERCPVCGSFLTKEDDSCPVCGNTIGENRESLSSEEDHKEEEDMGEYMEKRIQELEGMMNSKPVEEVQKEPQEDEEVRPEDGLESSLEEVVEELEEGETEEIVYEIKDLEERIEDTEEKIDSREKEGRERYEAYPGELEEDKARIRDVLEELDNDKRLPTEFVEKEFDELLSYEKNRRYGKALDLALDILFHVEHLEKLKAQVDKAEDRKEYLSTEKRKKTFSDTLEKIKDKCESGEYKEALEISKTLTDLYRNKQKEKLEKKFKKKLRKVRKNLKVARETPIELESIKINVKEGIESKKSGNIKKGLSELEETLDRLEDIFVFSSKLEDAKAKLDQLRESGENTGDLSKRLKKLKDLAEEGNLNQANNLIDNFLGTINERKRQIEHETEEEKIKGEEEKTDDARIESIKDRITKANEEPILSSEKDKKD